MRNAVRLQPKNRPLDTVTGVPSGPWRSMVCWPRNMCAEATWQSSQPLTPSAMRVGAVLWLMENLTYEAPSSGVPSSELSIRVPSSSSS